MSYQQTLVLLKPDSLKRQLIGRIVARFERAGLTVVGLKMVQPSRQLVDRHYPKDDPESLKAVGQRARLNFEKSGLDLEAAFGTTDPAQIGALIQSWNCDFLTSGPVVAMVLSAPEAIAVVRKLRGSTVPGQSPPGTILGDFSFDNVDLASSQGRPLHNLIHASSSPEEAATEIKLWFEPDQIYPGPGPIQEIMTGGS